MTEHPNLAAALVAALAELPVIPKTRTADAGSYKYDYADLEGVRSIVLPILASHGLAVRTPVHAHGAGLAVTVKFLHVSGETLDDEPLPFSHGRDAQATGSAITYYRRYALSASLNLVTGEDDDGAAAKPQEQVVDDYTPGLRTSVEAAIGKLDEDGKAALKAWMAESDLPAVRRMNADQLARTIDHLMAVPDPVGAES